MKVIRLKQNVSPRFAMFKAAMRRELGMTCDLMADGRVYIGPNEFSGPETVNSLQEAIDRYFRYMPEKLQLPEL